MQSKLKIVESEEPWNDGWKPYLLNGGVSCIHDFRLADYNNYGIRYVITSLYGKQDMYFSSRCFLHISFDAWSCGNEVLLSKDGVKFSSFQLGAKNYSSELSNLCSAENGQIGLPSKILRFWDNVDIYYLGWDNFYERND